MKKILLTSLFCLFLVSVHGQCTISPYIQQNYELDAKRLAFREIQSNPNDPDYDNLFVPDERVTPYLEKLSAIYQNPSNNPSIDSLLNEFQFRVNPSSSEPIFEKIHFNANTSLPWVQALKDTGVSGYAALDDFMNLYQLSYEEHYDNSNNTTYFTLGTSYDVLNFRVIMPDFQAIPDIIYAYASEESPILGPPYTGVPYYIDYGPYFGGASVSLCDIWINDEGHFVFWLGGGSDCFNGCQYTESRYVSVSDDCSQVDFARTLSTTEVELTNVSIHPNPTSTILHIEGITNIQQVKIYSILGKQVQITPNNFTRIDVSTLTNGVYFLNVIDAQNRSITKKFIKQ